MRHIIYYTFFLIILCISKSSAAITSPVGFPSGIADLIPAQASRTKGVAPLSVFFNADITASSATEQSFHDYEYNWDFGDPNSGTWSTTGASKNTHKGPVASHIYETPGIYTVKLTVKNSSDGSDIPALEESFTITVTDPDTVFAETRTTCISDTSHNDFAGCPNGATQIATNTLAATLSQYSNAGERILLHRGSSWTVSAQLTLNNSKGPVTLGAYGTCASPDSLGICSNAPLISSTANVAIISGNRKHDFRITDLSFSAPMENTAGYLYSGTQDTQQWTFLRIKATGFNTIINQFHYRADDTQNTENIVIAECDFSGSDGMTVFVGGENVSIIGNKLYNSEQSHILRIWGAYKGVVSHNLISGASAWSSQGRHALKLHAPEEKIIGTFAETGSSGVPFGTHFVVVSGNVFGSSGPWTVSIEPQDDLKDERINDLVFERNKILTEYGEGTTEVQASIMFSGQYGTIRNNIVDGSGSYNGSYSAIVIERRGAEPPPLGSRVYNNTVQNRDHDTQIAVGVSVHTNAIDTIIRNNYVSFPNALGTKTLITDNSAIAITSNNVITDNPYFVDADNQNPLSRDFSLTSSSTEAIDKGYAMPVLDDFMGNNRAGLFDIGAFSY